jgi:hypothetical protein
MQNTTLNKNMLRNLIDWSKDENACYEDEEIIVLQATDPSDPNATVKNCKKYGKGLNVCISTSTAKTECYKDRWLKKVTVYFVWLKKKSKFILVDATPNGRYQYNHITKINEDGRIYTCNHDERETSPNNIVKVYPELQKAFECKAFKYVEMQQAEINFFQRLENASSVLELKNFNDQLDYVATYKVVTEEEWLKLNNEQGYRLFKEYISSRASRSPSERDVSQKVLDMFSGLSYRYWTKVKQDGLAFMEFADVQLSPHEKKILKQEVVLERPATSKGFLHRLISLLFCSEEAKKELRASYLKKLIVLNNAKKHIAKTIFGVEVFEITELMLICPLF